VESSAKERARPATRLMKHAAVIAHQPNQREAFGEYIDADPKPGQPSQLVGKRL